MTKRDEKIFLICLGWQIRLIRKSIPGSRLCDLAKTVNLCPQSWCQIETGKITTTSTLFKICFTLGVTFSDLSREAEEMFTTWHFWEAIIGRELEPIYNHRGRSQ